MEYLDLFYQKFVEINSVGGCDEEKGFKGKGNPSRTLTCSRGLHPRLAERVYGIRSPQPPQFIRLWQTFARLAIRRDSFTPFPPKADLRGFPQNFSPPEIKNKKNTRLAQPTHPRMSKRYSLNRGST